MISEKSRRIIERLPIFLLIILSLIGGIIISLSMIYNSEINFINSAEMIRDLAKSCITISSIVLAAVLAVTAILINNKSADKEVLWVLDICMAPVFGVITGLFSLYYSYIAVDFQIAKSLLGLSIILAILGILLIYVFLEFKRDPLLDNRPEEKGTDEKHERG